MLERLAQFRGKPSAIRSDQGPEFAGKALDQWAYRNGVQLKLMEPGKPSQNDYIESFNGRIGDECLNDHWLTRLADARTRIAARLPSASAAERTALPDTGRICSQLAAKIAQ